MKSKSTFFKLTLSALALSVATVQGVSAETLRLLT